ncbi:sensor histidine kinase [Peribacillus glennii]|uniref:sensor histidine kinase n=1 Tax=Peribacillus glennii TaxID=2303991 RepID=UPI001F1CB20E|nr:HAMP domain-containing sensor histidine kinase [Peribacillus glennii]
MTSTFRFLLGGESLLLSFIFLPFFYTVPFIFSFLWNKFSKRQKYLCAVLIGTANVAVFYLILFIFQAKVGDHGFIPDNSIPSFLLGGLLYVAILFIIIFYEEYMEENTLMRIQILNSEKMNVVSELAASVAHEVRNPLTVVKGFIQLIVKDDKSANQDYMKLVLSELSRAESIISDFLNLARKNTERRETFLISSLVKDVMNVMKSYSNMNGVNLFFSLEADGELHGDINKLKQVFYNLIKNAVESINHPGGEVSILVLKKGEDAVIEIIDNGIGMSQSQLEKIGEPFYTRKETGTGLGVMVTKSIIESHNGSITYESSPGEGTKAIITLPFHKSETN